MVEKNWGLDKFYATYSEVIEVTHESCGREEVTYTNILGDDSQAFIRFCLLTSRVFGQHKTDNCLSRLGYVTGKQRQLPRSKER